MAKEKVFQDATQGYISIEEIYVRNLIDTYYVQREKSVSQVGLRSIFSGANHDRFSHSLGVFNIGKQIYSSFKNSVLDWLSNSDKREFYEIYLEEYQVLFYVACILHDIGHPALSHSLEYIYDSDYIYLNTDNKKVDLNAYIKHLIERYFVLKKNNNLSDETYLQKSFLEKLKEQEGDSYFIDSLKAAQHEIMGAYIILSDETLQNHISNVLKEKHKENSSLFNYVENKDEDKEKISNDYFGFIARMITGYKYPYDYALQDCEINEHNRTLISIRNCIISLLNGKIDADSIDYLNRNSHFAGYSTNNIDITRLCAAFTTRYQDDVFSVCINKSALSSLEGFIQARNFEPKWLYSHHKVAYYNLVMIKYLLKMTGEYLFENNSEKIEKEFLSVLFNDRKIKYFFSEKINDESEISAYLIGEYHKFKSEIPDDQKIAKEKIIKDCNLLLFALEEFPIEIELITDFNDSIKTFSENAKHSIILFEDFIMNNYIHSKEKSQDKAVAILKFM